jgi:hypothetical protein
MQGEMPVRSGGVRSLGSSLLYRIRLIPAGVRCYYLEKFISQGLPL